MKTLFWRSFSLYPNIFCRAGLLSISRPPVSTRAIPAATLSKMARNFASRFCGVSPCPLRSEILNTTPFASCLFFPLISVRNSFLQQDECRAAAPMGTTSLNAPRMGLFVKSSQDLRSDSVNLKNIEGLLQIVDHPQ